MQIWHAGRAAHPALNGGAETVSSSALAVHGDTQTPEGKLPNVVPRALRTVEIPALVEAFAQAARNAVQAGFDGVEIHAASGYLIHQFLDPTINRRDDLYGGSIENRARFLLLVVDRVAEAVGRDRVGLKISPRIRFNDVVEPDAEDMYPHLARELSSRGIAYLHGAKQGEYDVHAALRPIYSGVYAAGAGFDARKAEELLAAGGADLIVFGKPFIANPDLPRRMREGLDLAEADKATIYSGGAQGYSDYPPAP
jgi:N-ethylmaleimide reductase